MTPEQRADALLASECPHCAKGEDWQPIEGCIKCIVAAFRTADIEAREEAERDLRKWLRVNEPKGKTWCSACAERGESLERELRALKGKMAALTGER